MPARSCSRPTWSGLNMGSACNRIRYAAGASPRPTCHPCLARIPSHYVTAPLVRGPICPPQRGCGRSPQIRAPLPRMHGRAGGIASDQPDGKGVGGMGPAHLWLNIFREGRKNVIKKAGCPLLVMNGLRYDLLIATLICPSTSCTTMSRFCTFQ